MAICQFLTEILQTKSHCSVYICLFLLVLISRAHVFISGKCVDVDLDVCECITRLPLVLGQTSTSTPRSLLGNIFQVWVNAPFMLTRCFRLSYVNHHILQDFTHRAWVHKNLPDAWHGLITYFFSLTLHGVIFWTRRLRTTSLLSHTSTFLKSH